MRYRVVSLHNKQEVEYLLNNDWDIIGYSEYTAGVPAYVELSKSKTDEPED